MHKVSAYIIAYNEAAKIEAAINSVLWADEIVLVDSYSTDNTVEIAESLGARVVQVPFTGFGDLRNRAMAACTHEWIFPSTLTSGVLQLHVMKFSPACAYRKRRPTTFPVATFLWAGG